MSLDNMTLQQAAFHVGKINKKRPNYREKYLNNLEIQIGATSVCPVNPGFN